MTRECAACGAPFTLPRNAYRNTRCPDCRRGTLAQRAPEAGRLVHDLGVDAAAVELGVHPDTLRRAIRAGVVTPTAPTPVPPAPGNWLDAAACRDHYAPDDFFDDRGDGAFRYARSVCSGCPVKAECLAEGHRIDAAWNLGGIGHGMWGGLTPRERARVRQQPPPAQRLTGDALYAAAMRERFGDPAQLESEAS